MSDARIFAGGVAAVGVAVVAAFFLLTNGTATTAVAQDSPGPNMVIELGGATAGQIVVDLRTDLAPKHVEQMAALAAEGAYDDVVFHRVIEGFMAQTGDVSNGKRGGDISMAGTGASTRPDLPAEFTPTPFLRGTVGMARSNDPNSGNSQFFIMFAPAEHLNGQYTVVGQVIEGMDVVDKIAKGDPGQNGLVASPDYMAKVTIQN
ncbi:MAG: peptidylprolyl isomerase [Paracoccaceae bacterium]